MDRHPLESPYLQGNYAPIAEESAFERLAVSGNLPRDLAGVFVRNASNARHVGSLNRQKFHWFDGDGMLHALRFQDGVASYRNRWIRTKAFVAEERAGKALWTGLLERPDFSHEDGPYKNTANTDVVFHAGQCLALWWMSGTPYVVKLPELTTEGVQTYGGKLLRGFTAHPKVDPRTGEMMFIHFSPFPPYLEYGVIAKDGQVAHHTPIELPGSRLQHDIAITERYTVLLDLSMHEDPELLKQGKVRVKFFRDQPSRFGLVPRFGHSADVKWFEVKPCYIYHLINAWEEGDEVVVVGCRIENPMVNDPENPRRDRPVPSIAFQRLEPALYRWRFHLVTGAVREEQLDDVMTEFPRMDNRRLGTKSHYSYNPRVAHDATLRFDGFVRYEHERGKSSTYEYPAGWFGGETVFAPRLGSDAENDGAEDDGAEDDGYVITLVAEESTGVSEAFVFDARDVASGPLARVRIPQRVPTGYHAYWVPEADLKAQRAL